MVSKKTVQNRHAIIIQSVKSRSHSAVFHDRQGEGTIKAEVMTDQESDVNLLSVDLFGKIH